MAEMSNEEIAKNVNQPKHYQSRSGQSAMDVIEDFGLQWNFYLANAIKYIIRCGKKVAAEEKQDIAKAIWYLRRFIQQIDKDSTNSESKTQENGTGK